MRRERSKRKSILKIKKRKGKLKKKYWISAVMTAVALGLILLLYAPEEPAVPEDMGADVSSATASGQEQLRSLESSTLEVHFIDCGQGDATLLVCGENTMLIDAGPDEKGTAIQYYLQNMEITELDYLAITHFDTDHAGGADVILQKFECETVLLPNYLQDNTAYRNIMDSLEYRNYQPVYPMVGQTYALGEALVTVVSPPHFEFDIINDCSICLLVTHGENTFLFTGDAEREGEMAMLEGEIPISADVYQVGHHGSNTSSSPEFLEAVQPSYAVISCGENNSYGHPHEEVLERLEDRDVRIFRTDLQGTVIAVSDGREIIWNTEG